MSKPLRRIGKWSGSFCSSNFMEECEKRVQYFSSRCVELFVFRKIRLNLDFRIMPCIDVSILHFVTWERGRKLTLFNDVPLRTRRALSQQQQQQIDTVITPFWFSTEHLWSALMPFWLLINNFIYLVLGIFPLSSIYLFSPYLGLAFFFISL